MPKLRVTALGLLLLVVFAAGCSPSEPSEGPTESERPEYAGTKTEYTQESVECLQAEGVQARVTHDEFGEPIIQIDVDPSATGLPPEVKAASDKCNELLPLPPSPDTPEKIRVAYDNQVAIYECAVAAGFVPDPPPSFGVYLESVQAGEIQWMPFDGLDEDYSAARLACPGDPDSWY